MNRREMLRKISGGGGILGYVDDGLLAMYDGIQNTRSGHSSSLSVWEDLSGNERDINYVANGNGITVNADNVKFNGGYFRNDNYMSISNTVMTIEAVCYTPAGNEVIMLFGTNNFILVTAPDGMCLCSAAARHICPQVIGTKNAIHEERTNLTLYVNNSEITERGNKLVWNYCNFYIIGRYPESGNQYSFTGNLYCIRLYNRILTDAERLQNYNNDVRRFGTMGV